MRTISRTILWLLLLGAPGWVGAQPQDAPTRHTGPVEDRARVCMMNDTAQQQPGIPHQYGGKTYYLCCQGCVEGFKANPERYRQAVDPVSGAWVDKAEALVYARDGRAYFFGKEEHRRSFADSPDEYLMRSMMPQPPLPPLEREVTAP